MAIPANKNIPITYIVLLSVVFTSVLFLISLYFQNQQLRHQLNIITPAQLPTFDPTAPPTLSPFADWQIYRNDQLGVEFKYPPEWSSPSSNVLSTRTEIFFGKANGQEKQEDQTNIPKLIVSIGFFYNQDLQRKMTLGEYSKKAKNFAIDGFIGTCHTHHENDYGIPITEITMAQSYNSTNIIDIFYRHPVNKSNLEIIESTVLDQILSTFKFLD